MTHRLVLDLPEEVYIPLAGSASRAGENPEQRAVAWLAAVGQHADRDPVERLIGSLPTQVADWASDHDRHLGTAQIQAMTDEPTE